MPGRRSGGSHRAAWTAFLTGEKAAAESKYGAEKTRGYASKKEARRADELKMMQRAGLISELEEQVRYELVPKQDGERAVTYVADFRYVENGAVVVEDTKGVATAVFVIKRKLMLSVYGIRVRVT